ncbi:MAG: LCP family protein [Clostridium sp.]|nr:LCP family protein [Clostridium sp.]
MWREQIIKFRKIQVQQKKKKKKILGPEGRRKARKRKEILAAAYVIIGLIVVVAALLQTVRVIGKIRLAGKVKETAPILEPIQPEELTEEEESKWQEGWIKHNGKVYAYNEEIITFLFMGIDKNSEAEEVEEGTNGGQADALFLAVINPRDKTIKLIGINRNAMTDIDIYDENGDYVMTTEAQISVQHGFGNGVEESCEYQVEAVSELFYQLPIHGYAAINMSAIATINDAVGGVDVTVLEDLTVKDASLVKGADVHLMGDTAFWYVKYRDTNIFASADMRLDRQKQYLNAFINTAKQAAKKDIGIVLDLYKAIDSRMVTDISLDEAAYLAPILLDYSFETSQFYLLSGETVRGEEFEEFYVDETALYELILEIFYEEVEQ